MFANSFGPRTRPVAVALLLATTASTFSGCGGDDDLAETRDPIEGVWLAAVTQRDCTTNAELGSFSGMQIMHPGGTLSDTNSAAPTGRGIGFGVWTGSGGAYTARFRFFRYNADGSLAGTNVVTRTIVLAADGNSHTATTRLEIRSVTGAVLQTGCASDVSTRFS